MGKKTQEGTEFSGKRIHVNTLFAPEEYVLLRDCAAAEGVALTAYIRNAIRLKMILDGRFYIEVNGEMKQIGGIPL